MYAQLYQILTDFQNYFTVRIRRKSRVLRCTLVNLVCLTGEIAIDNAVRDYHKRLQTCLSATVDILNI